MNNLYNLRKAATQVSRWMGHKIEFQRPLNQFCQKGYCKCCASVVILDAQKDELQGDLLQKNCKN